MLLFDPSKIKKRNNRLNLNAHASVLKS